MRLSVFNLYVSDHPEPGTTLVYNSFTGSFAEVPNQLIDRLRAGDASVSDEYELEHLQEAGMLTESVAAEEKAFRDWHETKRSTSDTLDVIVSTTFACNFDCTYCCQSDVLDGRMMKDDVGAQTARWLAEKVLELGARRITIAFVGGEPLLHPKRIEQLLADLRRLTDDAVDVRWSLITNGLFLTKELVAKWKPLGLIGAQVTLDGDETTHKLTRPSKKGEDTFATIFRNVIANSGEIEIFVNGNYTAATSHGFIPLIAKLREAGLKPGNRVFFSPALQALGAPSDAAAGSCTWSGSMPEYMLAFHDEVVRAGFQWRDLVEVGPCAFHNKQHYAIDPEGNIYKCPGFLGKTEWAVGHVETGLNARWARLANANPQRECGSCAHRPHCAGGCIAAEWLRVGRAEGVNCEIEFFNQHGDELLKRKYALEGADDPIAALAACSPASQVPRPPVAVHDGKRVALRVLAA